MLQTNRLLTSTLLSLLVASVVYGQGKFDKMSYHKQFTQQVESLNSQKQTADDWLDRWTLYEASKDLIKDIGHEGSEYLAAIVANPGYGETSRQLAMMTLARIGSDHAATAISEHLVYPDGSINLDALVAISYLPEARRRATIESWLKKMPDAKAIKATLPIAQLCTIVGDQGTLEVLIDLRWRTEDSNHAELIAPLNSLIEVMTERLDNAETAGQKELREELLFWQALNEERPKIFVVDKSYEMIPERMISQGITIDSRFLIDLVGTCRNVSTPSNTSVGTIHDCNRMAMALLARQHPKEASDCLRPYVLAHGEWTHEILFGLYEADKVTGLRLMEEAISPRERFERENQRIAKALSFLGDRQTLQVLTALKTDPRFSESTRAVFRKSADNLQTRLDAGRGN